MILKDCRVQQRIEGKPNRTFLVGRALGSGSFATVYEAYEGGKGSATQIALKVIAKDALSPDLERKLAREVQIHSALEHPHIVRLKGAFQDDRFHYLIMELCAHQSLSELLKRRRFLSEPEVRYYLRQLARALGYLHQQRIIHRDIKLANLFLGEGLVLKLGDFGFAAQVQPNGFRHSVCGTPNFMSPEIVTRSDQGHSFPADIWSFGALAYTLLIGNPPFQMTDVDTTYRRIKTGTFQFPKKRAISPLAMDFIRWILQLNPHRRPTATELDSHPFLADLHVPSALPLTSLVSRPLPQFIDQFTPKEPFLKGWAPSNAKEQQQPKLESKALQQSFQVQGSLRSQSSLRKDSSLASKMVLALSSPTKQKEQKQPQRICPPNCLFQEAKAKLRETQAQSLTLCLSAAQIHTLCPAVAQQKQQPIKQTQFQQVPATMLRTVSLYQSDLKAPPISLNEPLPLSDLGKVVQQTHQPDIQRCQCLQIGSPNDSAQVQPVQPDECPVHMPSPPCPSNNFQPQELLVPQIKSFDYQQFAQQQPTEENQQQKPCQTSSLPEQIQEIDVLQANAHQAIQQIGTKQINCQLEKQDLNSPSLQPTKQENEHNLIQHQLTHPSLSQPPSLQAGKQIQQPNQQQSQLEQISSRSDQQIPKQPASKQDGPGQLKQCTNVGDRGRIKAQLQKGREANGTQNRGQRKCRSPVLVIDQTQSEARVQRFVGISKYGVGYWLSNGVMGVLFNDYTKLLHFHSDRLLQYYDASNALLSQFKDNDPPQPLAKKTALLARFRRELGEREGKPSVGPGESVFVRKWLQAAEANVFKLTDGRMQVVFRDGVELVISPQRKEIRFVREGGESVHHISETRGFQAELRRRVRQLKTLIRESYEGQEGRLCT